MRHHYWEWPIATYLFLGGLGGGIFTLISIFTFFVWPQAATIPECLAWPAFLAILCLGFGCFLLVFELGQPLVFLRVFLKNTSIICWGARILSVCLIFGLLWFCSYITSWDWFLPVVRILVPLRGLCLALAGITGLGIMLYTGILLSSLKAHSFWATPALPVLFTCSALSTACAAISLSAGFWPAEFDMNSYMSAALYVATISAIHEMVHLIDIILVVVELAILLIMVLSFLGAGNKTAHDVAAKWVRGSWCWLFWGGMIFGGLVLPELMYLFWGGVASAYIAPILVLCGGLLLRFMIVYSDERAPLPGEVLFYEKLPSDDALFIHKWTYGKNIY